MKIKAKIIVKGIVQGVGFRYFCYRKAVEYGVTGFAKNLINGDVEVQAEGEENFVRDFIKELKIGPRDSVVKSISIDELPFKNEFEEFKI